MIVEIVLILLGIESRTIMINLVMNVVAVVKFNANVNVDSMAVIAFLGPYFISINLSID